LVTDWSRVLIDSTVESEGDRICLVMPEPRELGSAAKIRVDNRQLSLSKS
jgi:hypothetical protein